MQPATRFACLLSIWPCSLGLCQACCIKVIMCNHLDLEGGAQLPNSVVQIGHRRAHIRFVNAQCEEGEYNPR